uniref:DUF3677 domain-containing protein n=1 Tax=Trichuris muris TaxID=70415 RepID=A0A5S6R1H3_TRIMR
MERKSSCSRPPKTLLSRQKANLPSGSFIALGSRAQGPECSSTLGVKRDGSSLPIGLTKKAKTKDVAPFSSGALSSQKNGSSATESSLSSGFQISSSLEVMETIRKGDCTVEVVEKLLCAIARRLREGSSCLPEPMLCAMLCVCAKRYPDLFRKGTVLEAFCELLRTCSVPKGVAEAHSNLRCLICSILMEAWKEETEWPELFAKVYLDDAMSERSWVDRQESRPFVKAILASFGTLLPSDAAWDLFLVQEDETFISESVDLALMVSSSDAQASGSCYSNRFTGSAEQLRVYVCEILREWWMRRADTIPKKVFLTISACTGLLEVRLNASQRLDNWLQNSRAPWAMAWLLISIWRNSSNFEQHDQEVISNLCKMRLKSKAFTRVFSLAVKESFLTSTSKATALLSFALRNEFSSNRANSHLTIIGHCFQSYDVLSTKTLACIMAEYLFTKEDCSRAMKSLFREVVRGVLKNEFPLPVFCQSLFEEASKAFKPDSPLKDRIHHCLEDVVIIATFLRIPSSREGYVASRKDCSLWDPVHQDIRKALHEVVVWLKNTVFRSFRLGREDYIRSYHRLLFLDRPECYVGKDGWPSESEKNLLLRTVAESGILEKTLIELVSVNQFGDYPFNLAVGVDLVDQIVRRASFNPFNGRVNLEVTKDFVGTLLKACLYRRPESISLPARYSPVPMAISSLYWKAWIVLVILSSTNPQTAGASLWKSYPTARFLMEMVIVEEFTFPPSTVVNVEQTVASFWNIEEEAVETERREILELETYLAAASTKQVITEENSLLLPQLMKYDPKGLARCPPAAVIDQISMLSKQLSLRCKLCASRSPDFLLDIIDRQGALQSLPWLSDIIKQNDDPFNLLPIECSCEFLINHPEAMMSDTGFDEAISASAFVSTGAQNAASEAQYRDKLRQMASNVKQLLWEYKDNFVQAKTALFYFMSRLNADSSSQRSLVIMLLENVLHRSHDVGQPLGDVSRVHPDLLKQFEWLFVSLERLPYFVHIKQRVVECILKNCEFETDPRRLHAYIHYAYLHLSDTTLETSCKALAKCLSKRHQTLARLVPYRGNNKDVLVDMTHNALLDLFAQYLRSTLHAAVGSELTEVKDGELQIQFHDGQSSIMGADVFHFMAYILVRRPSVEAHANYKFIFSHLLGEDGSKPPMVCPGGSGQVVDLFNAPLLSLFMLSENEMLVDRVTIGLNFDEVYRCLRQFGLPVNNANKLLGKLDHLVAAQMSIDERTFSKLVALRRFVLFYRSNGASGGEAFLRCCNMAEPPAGAQSDHPAPCSTTISICDSSLVEYQSNISIPSLLNELFVGKRDGVALSNRSHFHEMMVQLVNEMATEGKKPHCHCCVDWLLNWQPSIKRKIPTALLNNRFQITALFCLLSKLKDVTLREAFGSMISRLTAANTASGTWFASLVKKIHSELHTTGEREDGSAVSFPISRVPFSSSIIDKVISWQNPELLHLSAEEIASSAFSKKETAESHIILTMIPHATKLSTITSVISALLSKFSDEPECSRVLDFVMASSRNPRVLKGRDSRPPRFDPGDRLLSLSVDQLLVLAEYTIAEFCTKLCLTDVSTFNGNIQPAIEWSVGTSESDGEYAKIHERSAYLETRMSTLLHYCETGEHLLRLIAWLEESPRSPSEKDVRQIMLLEIYFKFPRMLSHFKTPDISSVISCLVHCRSNKLDLVLHTMICKWARLAKFPGKEGIVGQIGSVLKRTARDHPCLMMRHLPLLASHLRGTTAYRTSQYCNSTYLLWFTIILALIENLAPHSFMPNYVSSTMDILNSFIGFARNYVIRFPRLIAFVDKVFVILKAFYAVNPELTISFMKSNASTLQLISNRYPELHNMRSLLSLISLSTSTTAGRKASPLPGGSSDGKDDQWTPLLVRPPSPVYTGQITQILNRLTRASQIFEFNAVLKEIEDLCQMKPDGFPYFKNELVRLLIHHNGDVRKAALCLIISCLNEHPSEIGTVAPMLEHCLNHPELAYAQTIADRLPDICRICPAKTASLLVRSACLRVNTLENIEQILVSSISAINTHCLSGLLSK